MRPADSIRDLFKQANIQADSDQTERILGDALKEIQKRSDSRAILKRPSRWRIIMKSKTAKLSTAAVVLLAVGLFFANINDTVVYAMSDVPALVRQAKSLHLKGMQYFPENNSSQSAQIEYWIDMKNNRWRMLSPSYIADGKELTVYPTEQVYNGSGTMMIVDYDKEQVVYFKLSSLQQALQQRRQVRYYSTTAFGTSVMFDHYQVVGHETIDGISYEIWEAIVRQHSTFSSKTNTWLDPRTGNLLKAKTWILSPGGVWQLKSDIEVIERDVELSGAIFSLKAPSGYTATCTVETAQAMPMGSRTIGMNTHILSGHLLFALPDGSLIACWSSKDESSSDSQQVLFSNLQPGGDLPELPYKVHAIKALLGEQEYVFTGCHLASTEKGGEYYEWGLYVANTDIPLERLQYRSFLLDYQTTDAVKYKGGKLWSRIRAVIETEDDFNDLILAAMAEFSDQGAAATLSLEEVLSLASRKRGD